MNPKIPKGPEPIDRAAIQETKDLERARQLRLRRGRKSTLLTGPEGVTADTSVVRPTLLGG